MRKITKEVVQALLNHQNYSKGNTTIITTDGYSSMYLYGNCIARYNPNGLEINHQGYLTKTTKERLNGLPGVKIQQKNFVWYLNGKEMLNGWNKV